MRRILYSFFLLLVNLGSMQAQDKIHGKVTDRQNNPIDGVAVVLQTIDSLYVDAILTDTTGQFSLNRPDDRTYRLLFQHLLYIPCQKEISSADAGIIRLEAKNYELEGVTVQAERPKVKVENGALKYDVPQLMKDKSLSNALEVVKQIPGVMGGEDEVQLIGAGNPAIVLNGQLTSMSTDQLVNLLKSVPASRVKNVEVMYNAPAKYNIRGAMINIILETGDSDVAPFQGEAGIEYQQRHYAAGKAYTNLLYSTSRLNVDFLAEANKGRHYMGEDIFARHTLENNVTEINQKGRGNVHTAFGTMRVGFDYTLKNKDKISGAYYLNVNKSDSKRWANTSFSKMRSSGLDSTLYSRTNSNDKSYLHNVRMQYDGQRGLMIGADFTRYHSPSAQYFLETGDRGVQTDMLNNSEQDISQYVLFLNQTHNFKTGWTLNYGIHGGFTSSKTYIDYLYDKGNGFEMAQDQLENNRQKEYNGNIFAEVSKNIGEHFSATVSLKAEYFKSDYTSNGKSTTLWHDWAFFPNATLMYTFNPQHILQLTVNSNKIYPSYWDITPQMTPINSYSVVVGNPSLKPYRSYVGQFLYILNQKYTFIAFCNFVPDYFTQLPYQSNTELKNVFRYENLDFQLQTGLGIVVPFRIGSFWNAQATLTGLRMEEKASAFYDISFRNTKYIGQIGMNNTFILSSARPNLKLDLNGFFVTGAVQGIYDLGYLSDLTAALKWQFASERATIMLKCNNILRSNLPHTIEINQDNQYSRLKKLDDGRCLTLSFIWKFGGYKKKEHDKVDSSRFGKS